MRAGTPLRSFALAAIAFLLPSCIATVNSHVSTKGMQVSEAQFDAIEPGDSPERVRALLGAPSDREKLSDGSEIWTWRSERSKHRETKILFLISAESNEDVTETFVVEFDDRGVTKTWRG